MTIESPDNPSRTFGVRHSVLVILLTILAGCLRFTSLDKPSIWGDEFQSWRRISGSYQQMVDELRTAGFMPAHYVLTWWVKEGFPVWGRFEPGPPPERGGGPWRRRDGGSDATRVQRDVFVPSHRLIADGLTPTPLVMRFIPALCGTLMVPAMYFLASQLVRRRTALLVALFTCCSAYQLGYSRDSKMYAQLWCFATLHFACLLWWLRAYAADRLARPVAWSAEHQDTGEGLSGVLTHEHVGHIARAFVVNAQIDPLAVRPITRLQTLVRWACWVVSGLAMISFQSVGLAIVGIEVLIFLVTVPHRLGWVGTLASRVRGRLARRRATVATRHDQFSDPVVERSWRFQVPPIVGFAVGVVAVVSLFNGYRSFSRFYERVEPDDAESAQFDLSESGIDWVERYNHRRTAPGHFLHNASAYLFNWEWVKPDQMAKVDPLALSRLRLATIVLLCAIGAGVLPWRRLLERITDGPRLHDRGPMPLTSMLVVGAWLLVPAYGFYCASGAWDEAGRRVAASLPNATIAGTLYPDAIDAADAGLLRGAVTNAMMPVFAGARTLAEARAMLGELPWRDLFVVRGTEGVRGVGALALLGALAILALSWPGRRWVEPIGPPLIGQVDLDAPSPAALRRRRAARWWADLLGHAARALFVLLLLWGLMLVVFLVVPQQERSVWMPRYLGFVWPAFAIAVCVLIDRLPLAPVRWLVVIALVAANLTNFWMRLQHGEPPTARIAADQVAIGDGRGAARMYAPVMAPMDPGVPGSGGPMSLPNQYYYSVMKPLATTPRGAFGVLDRAVEVRRGNNDYAQQVRGAARDARTREIYVWATVRPDRPEEDVEKALRGALPATWQPAEPRQRWQCYDHWTWRNLYALERHHWTKVEPATTTTATTRPRTSP